MIHHTILPKKLEGAMHLLGVVCEQEPTFYLLLWSAKKHNRTFQVSETVLIYYLHSWRNMKMTINHQQKKMRWNWGVIVISRAIFYSKRNTRFLKIVFFPKLLKNKVHCFSLCNISDEISRETKNYVEVLPIPCNILMKWV